MAQDKERPILFKGPMVLALMEGRKTQTRRVLKNEYFTGHCCQGDCCHFGGSECVDYALSWCPHGKPGDSLWVRESFYIDDLRFGGPLPKEKPAGLDMANVYYAADGDCCTQIPECAEVGKPRWKSSIHMPRWASRIDLSVTEVRVERLQSISQTEAIAEGIERVDQLGILRASGWKDYSGKTVGFLDPIDSYRTLWESINGPDSWPANPWVFVIAFDIERGAK